MQLNSDEIIFLFPENTNLDIVRSIVPDEIFSDFSVGFLSALSMELSRYSEIRRFPDVATFAFFCRKANLLSLKKKYEDGAIHLGRGVVFHVAPSNVPVNFAYSMVAGILGGNINIVRVPSKPFEQVVLICKAIEQVVNSSEFLMMKERLFLIRYGKQSQVTEYLSSLCDVRVIWGGDETIAQIRKSVMLARSYDITFADRYSIAAIHADSLINENNLNRLAEGFYNDTYLFDQNACSAPRLVIWTGKKESIENARNLFWNAVQERLTDYNLSPLLAVDKLSTFYWQSTKCNGIKRERLQDNKLWRIKIEELSENIDEYRCAGGYFLEYCADSLNDLQKIVNRKYQTIAYYGYSKEELAFFVKTARLNGVDRIVPIGKTTDFSLVWDGFDLIRMLSRICTIL